MIKYFEIELKQADSSPIFKSTYQREKLYNISLRDLRTNFDQSNSDTKGEKRKYSEISTTINDSNKKAKVSEKNRSNATSIFCVISNGIENSNNVVNDPFLTFEKRIRNLLQKIDNNKNGYGFDVSE